MTEQFNLMFVFGAGLASVLSPCVLPVLPIVVTGGSNDSKLRPVLVVVGLSSTFILMGVLSALFGSVVGAQIYYVEKVVALLIVAMGVLLVANVNLFKHLSILSQLAGASRGASGGFILGGILGIIWIPCVGPMLSGVLALVATDGKMFNGMFYLLIYSLGFAIPMLLAGYASHFFRQKMSVVSKHPRIISTVSGLILIFLGAFILIKGMVGFGA